jgi:Txe/YoeB family toxin of Txe-Axe toxin-antitoxin module
MHRNIVILATVTLLLASRVIGAETPAPVDVEQVTIAGLHIGDPREAVTSRLGKPTRETKPEFEVFCSSEADVWYETAEVSFCDDKLVNLLTNSAQYETAAGIRVGMSVSDALKIYGPPEKLASDDEELLAYRTTDREQALILHVREGKIVALELWCDFT